MINVIQVKINHMTINETTVEYKGKNPRRKTGEKNRIKKEREGGNKEERDLWFILCKSLEVGITHSTEAESL